MAARRRAMPRWLMTETAAIIAPRNATAAVRIAAKSAAFDIMSIVLWSPFSAVVGATVSDPHSIAALGEKADSESGSGRSGPVSRQGGGRPLQAIAAQKASASKMPADRCVASCADDFENGRGRIEFVRNTRRKYPLQALTER